LATSKWHSWKHRYGKANEHNAWIPRDHWLEDEDKQAIRKLEAARERRKAKRHAARQATVDGQPAACIT